MKKYICSHILYGFIAILVIICVSSRPVYAAGGNRINKSKVTLLVSQSVKLSIAGKSSGVRWSSSDKKIAKVSSKGMVTGKKPGKATIKAKVGSKTYKCKVTVKIGLTKKSVNLTVGGTTKIKLCGTKVRKVKSSNKAVATIDKKGTIKAVGAGTATLTIEGKNKKKYTCKVTVKKKRKQAGNGNNNTGTGNNNTGTGNNNTGTGNSTSAASYQVSFDSDGGTAVVPQTVKTGETASVPEIPSRDGSIFDHWAINGSAYDFSTPVTADITLTAIWGSGNQTWDNAKEVKQVIDVKIAPEVLTEAQAVEEMGDRGFSDYEVTYDFDMNGEYCEDAEATAGSGEERPRYTTYFMADSGDVWTIYLINGSVYAYPASFNLQSGQGIEVLVSETEEVTSYDYETNKYYVTVPDGSNVKVIVVDKIDEETLNALSNGELSSSG